MSLGYLTPSAGNLFRMVGKMGWFLRDGLKGGSGEALGVD